VGLIDEEFEKEYVGGPLMEKKALRAHRRPKKLGKTTSWVSLETGGPH